MLLDGSTDLCSESATGPVRGASYYQQLTAGLEPSGARPRVGVWHVISQGGDPAPSSDQRPVGWDDDLPTPPSTVSHDGPLGGLRMQACEDQDWDETAEQSAIRPTFHYNDAPAGGGVEAFRSAMIFTNQAPVGGGCGPHESVAMSGNVVGLQCMPTDAVNGNGATSADDTHLFDAYVQAFCHLGSQ